MFNPLWIARLLLGRLVLPVLERLTEAPIMRQRINAGSDRYFAERDAAGDDDGLDELFEPFGHR